MRGGEETGFEAESLQPGRRLYTHRPLPIGARNMNYFELAPVGITKESREFDHLVQVECLSLFGVFFAEESPPENGIQALHVPLLDVGGAFLQGLGAQTAANGVGFIHTLPRHRSHNLICLVHFEIVLYRLGIEFSNKYLL